jgi:hypothetical protein
MIYAEKSEDTSSERTIKHTTVEKQNQFSLNDRGDPTFTMVL